MRRFVRETWVAAVASERRTYNRRVRALSYLVTGVCVLALVGVLRLASVGAAGIAAWTLESKRKQINALGEVG